jgi:hypothetical protein
MPTRVQALKTKAKLLQKAKLKAGKPIRLKEAFAHLARMSGFSSWRDLKANLEQSEIFCPPGHSAQMKTWYASYGDAVSHLAARGGYLLPYQKAFFLCDEGYLRFLGLSPNDMDLQKVGNNWAEPKDGPAFQRLLKKLKREKRRAGTTLGHGFTEAEAFSQS